MIRAKYEGGVFKPLEEVKLKEGTVLELRLPSEKRTSIKGLPFAGMWKNRTDIVDGGVTLTGASTTL